MHWRLSWAVSSSERKTIVNAECRVLLSLARQRKPLGIGAFSVSLGRFLNYQKVKTGLPHHAFFTAR